VGFIQFYDNTVTVCLVFTILCAFVHTVSCVSVVCTYFIRAYISWYQPMARG